MMNKSIHKLALLGLVIAAASTAACTNTVQGAGEDIERAGEEVQKVAK
jgi:predicted small secreted protein